MTRSAGSRPELKGLASAAYLENDSHRPPNGWGYTWLELDQDIDCTRVSIDLVADEENLASELASGFGKLEGSILSLFN